MHAKIRNEYGTISIYHEVIARIAGLAASDCYGIVGMAAKNVKDGFVQLLKMESLTKGIRLTNDADANDEISIDLHIIVEYGTNIPAIADSLIGTVKYQVEEATGLLVSQVNIYIEGMRVD